MCGSSWIFPQTQSASAAERSRAFGSARRALPRASTHAGASWRVGSRSWRVQEMAIETTRDGDWPTNNGGTTVQNEMLAGMIWVSVWVNRGENQETSECHKELQIEYPKTGWTCRKPQSRVLNLTRRNLWDGLVGLPKHKSFWCYVETVEPCHGVFAWDNVGNHKFIRVCPPLG